MSKGLSLSDLTLLMLLVTDVENSTTGQQPFGPAKGQKAAFERMRKEGLLDKPEGGGGGYLPTKKAHRGCHMLSEIFNLMSPEMA